MQNADQTWEQRVCGAEFSSEVPKILEHLGQLSREKGYEFDPPQPGWTAGTSATIRKGGNWLSITARTPEELGTFQSLAGARGFKINTSWRHEVLLYRDLQGWHAWNPALLTTGSVEVPDPLVWLDTQIMRILD